MNSLTKNTINRNWISPWFRLQLQLQVLNVQGINLKVNKF